MNKKGKVILLPTNRTDGTLWKTTNGQLIHTHVSGEYKQKYQPHYLCIVTEDEIKEGDWCLFFWDGMKDGELGQVGSEPQQYFPENGHMLNRNLRKIIATTDPDLWHSASDKYAQGCALIPQSFIEQYCMVGGIDEVDVEYGLFHDGDFKNDGNTHSFETISRPKVNSNNEIIIHPIEDKVYTRKELYKLCKVAYRMGAQNHEDATVERLDEWFNLLK